MYSHKLLPSRACSKIKRRGSNSLLSYSEAEGCLAAPFRFPRLLKNLGSRFLALLSGLAGEFFVGEPLADDLSKRLAEAVRVSHVFSVIVAECLFIEVPEQVKRFHTHVGAGQVALQEAPEVFEPVGVDLTVGIGFSVVDDIVSEFWTDIEIGRCFIGEQVSARLDILPNVWD